MALPTRTAPRLAAALAPLIALGLAVRHVTRDAAPTGRALLIDRRLVDEPPVLVLGSSLARADVLPDVAAAALGLPEGAVEVLTIPNATLPHVYAMLAHRVYGNHHRPSLVVVVGALTSVITPGVIKDVNVDRLMNLVDRYDPVLDAKVFGSSRVSFAWYLNRERAGRMRDRALDGWRDHALGLMFGIQGEAWEGARLAERVDEVVYAPDRMDRGLSRAAPTGMYAGAFDEISLDGVDPERDSLIPDLADLAAAHRARLVFVRTPFPPSNANNDLVAPEQEAAAIASMRAHGAVWIDLRAMGLPEDRFQDLRHMTPEGADAFTRRMAAEILGAYDARASATDLAPTPPTRAPAPCVPLPDVDARLPTPRCDGPREARWADDPAGPPSWWVLPGEVDAWSLPADAQAVTIVGHAWAPGPQRFERTLTPGGSDERLSLDACAGCAPTLRVAPRELTLIDHVVARGPDGDRYLVGRPETLGTRAARLLGGRVEDTALQATFDGPPPPLPAVEPRKAPHQTGVFVVPSLAALADAAETLASRPDRCSPLRVLEDGVPLARPHERCPDVGGLRGGRTCHAGDALYFSASDGAAPAGSGRTYTLALDPTRGCDARGVAAGTPLRGLVWLYPGDVVHVAVSPDQLRRLRDGVSRVIVEADRVFAGPAPALTVALRADGVTLAAGWVDGSRAELSLRSAWTALDRALDVELRADPGSWWLVRRVLVADGPLEVTEVAAAAAADPLGLLTP